MPREQAEHRDDVGATQGGREHGEQDEDAKSPERSHLTLTRLLRAPNHRQLETEVGDELYGDKGAPHDGEEAEFRRCDEHDEDEVRARADRSKYDTPDEQYPSAVDTPP